MTASKDITSVEWLGDHRLLLSFDNGEQREIDIAATFPLNGIFERLRDPEFFRQVRVVPDVGTIVWPNGADICPDVLYEKSAPAKGVASRPHTG